MPRPITHTSSIARAEAFRDAFGITERQTELIVALMAANRVGLGPVTSRQLEALVSRDVAHKTGELQSLRLIECVGFGDGRQKLWRATPTAYRRLGYPVPHLEPVEAPEVSRAEVMQDRYEERRRIKLAEKYRRERESA